jgi:FMN phosphatase YigB (HAD superfamily)
MEIDLKGKIVPPRLLVTDLDNTLYDWVTYFVTAFYAMVDELVAIVPVGREQLLDEFRDIHRRHHNSEHPFAVLELPSLQTHFGAIPKHELLAKIDPALHAFNRARRDVLRLYAGVSETLVELAARGTTIVAHTEAVVPNAYFRLEMLGIRKSMKCLYALDGPEAAHPRGTAAFGAPPPEFVHIVPPSERKPNPSLLLDICARENVRPGETWYVGDSLTRDISMAKQAGVLAIWAKYGTTFDRSLWTRLVRVTHWTDEDVAREAELRSQFANVQPDLSIDSFAELLTLAGPST